jgi:steroid 5-alpha reductase family enzyme
MWVSLCIMPVLAINAAPSIALSSAALGSSVLLTDVLGLGLWAGGFLTEVVADRQKSQWLKEKRNKQHDEDFLTKGLFGKRYASPAIIC